MTRTWKPLLQGSVADAALRTVQEIAEALAQRPSEEGLRRASLAGGTAGQAVFYTYLALHTGDEAAADRAAALLDAAAEELATTPMPPSFYSGFSGVAWAMEHLKGRLFEDDPDGDDPVLDIDEALIAPLSRPNWPGEYDLVGGLIGVGVYALERLPRPSGKALLEQVVDRLAERADTMEEGRAWFTRPEGLPEWQREIHQRGIYNLGVAHGLPGAFPVLAGACAAGVAVDRARPLLDDIVRWLLARRLEPGKESCYGTSYAPWEPLSTSRLAWCYGDPGIAATLLVAAQAVHEPEWEREARDVARRAAERPESTALVRDAGLCHGAAGLGHLFNRIYQSTGDERVGEAARFWFERTLALRQEGQDVAGYAAWELNEGKGAWRPDSGFLEGATGVGLALLAAVSEIEPAWDRILLLSIPAPS
ncbi:MAG: lanthionine synthetase C family protein [Thermoanaerobaculia bacterium]